MINKKLISNFIGTRILNKIDYFIQSKFSKFDLLQFFGLFFKNL